jgi:hypothetical protein
VASPHAPCETHEVEAKLRELGWVPGECNCGCGPAQSKACAVLYTTADGDVFPAAIFDHVRCDWGGKLSGFGPIVRYKRARDYLGYGEPPAGSRMIFFCPGRRGANRVVAIRCVRRHSSRTSSCTH